VPPGEPPSRPDPREDRSGGVALWSPPESGVARPDDRAGGHRLWAVTPCGADPRAVRVGARAPDAPGINPNPERTVERPAPAAPRRRRGGFLHNLPPAGRLERRVLG